MTLDLEVPEDYDDDFGSTEDLPDEPPPHYNTCDEDELDDTWLQPPLYRK